MVTRMVEDVYYTRIVVEGPDGDLNSIDARPGDSLSLAVQLGRPIYVSRSVARCGRVRACSASGSAGIRYIYVYLYVITT